MIKSTERNIQLVSNWFPIALESKYITPHLLRMTVRVGSEKCCQLKRAGRVLRGSFA